MYRPPSARPVAPIPSEGRVSRQPWQVWRHLPVSHWFEPGGSKLCCRRGAMAARTGMHELDPVPMRHTSAVPRCVTLWFPCQECGTGQSVLCKSQHLSQTSPDKSIFEIPRMFRCSCSTRFLKETELSGLCFTRMWGDGRAIVWVPPSPGLTTGFLKTGPNRCLSHAPCFPWCSQPPGQPVPLVLGEVLLSGPHPLWGPTHCLCELLEPQCCPGNVKA